MFDGIVEMPRKAVLDEESCEIEDEKEQLSTLELKLLKNYQIM